MLSNWKRVAWPGQHRTVRWVLHWTVGPEMTKRPRENSHNSFHLYLSFVEQEAYFSPVWLARCAHFTCMSIERIPFVSLQFIRNSSDCMRMCSRASVCVQRALSISRSVRRLRDYKSRCRVRKQLVTISSHLLRWYSAPPPTLPSRETQRKVLSAQWRLRSTKTFLSTHLTFNPAFEEKRTQVFVRIEKRTTRDRNQDMSARVKECNVFVWCTTIQPEVTAMLLSWSLSSRTFEDKPVSHSAAKSFPPIGPSRFLSTYSSNEIWAATTLMRVFPAQCNLFHFQILWTSLVEHSAAGNLGNSHSVAYHFFLIDLSFLLLFRHVFFSKLGEWQTSAVLTVNVP